MVAHEIRRREAGVHAVRRDAGAGEARGELVGEEDVGQLRLRVGEQADVASCALEIAKGDATESLEHRRDGDDARSAVGGAAPERGQELVGEEEGGEVAVDFLGDGAEAGLGVAG